MIVWGASDRAELMRERRVAEGEAGVEEERDAMVDVAMVTAAAAGLVKEASFGRVGLKREVDVVEREGGGGGGGIGGSVVPVGRSLLWASSCASGKDPRLLERAERARRGPSESRLAASCRLVGDPPAWSPWPVTDACARFAAEERVDDASGGAVADAVAAAEGVGSECVRGGKYHGEGEGKEDSGAAGKVGDRGEAADSAADREVVTAGSCSISEEEGKDGVPVEARVCAAAVGSLARVA